MAPRPPSQQDIPKTIWLLVPYFTGSHQAWAESYSRHSHHRVELLTMAGRFWKWRMQGGAIELARLARRHLAAGQAPQAIIATDMVNLPAWLGLLRQELPPQIPLLYYMHENQLTYPWRPGEKPDLTYAMINWLSQLCAQTVAFNSHYHLESWFQELPRLLKHFPDYNHLELIEQVRSRSMVVPVGIELISTDRPDKRRAPALILWNQRWEYDKRPDRFFDLLYRLQADGTDFRLAVAGENFRNVPEEFHRARRRLARHIVHWGYLPSAADYRKLLAQADLVISTADHEFLGISVLEAISAGAFPLLPRRLSYPELIPPELHPACLYENEEDLLAKARQRLATPRAAPPSLQRHVVRHFAWQAVAPHYDRLLNDLAHHLNS